MTLSLSIFDFKRSQEQIVREIWISCADNQVVGIYTQSRALLSSKEGKTRIVFLWKLYSKIERLFS